MWQWLSDPNIQKTLAFLGAGIAAFAAAAWAIFKFVHEKSGKKPTIMADRGGMAAGRDNIVGASPQTPSPRKRV